LRICILYDCLYPWTVGGAERWYRQLAQAHAARGHAVTYLTLRQWDHGAEPDLPGVEIVAVGPRLALYAGGKRRVLPPLLFGLGVLAHLLRRGGGYDVVHGASFPFFSVLAAGIVRPLHGYRLAVDWHEVWTRDYWRAYLGTFGGTVGWLIQRLCARIRQVPFSFSRLHAARAEALGTGAVTLLEGEYAGGPRPTLPAAEPPFVLYAGRLIPDKRARLLIEALAQVMAAQPALGAELVGSGPELEGLRAQVSAAGLSDRIRLPGFIPTEQLEELQAKAAVSVLPSAREGYGMVVVEASARGVPIVLVPGEDNAAAELVEHGANGFVAASAAPEALAAAISAALEGGPALRERVADWYAANARRLSFSHSFERILARLSADRGLS